MIITIYHFQSDDQSEHTNQILQYALEEASNDDFTDFLSAFKWVFNNSVNAFTDQILNERIQNWVQDSSARSSRFNCMSKSCHEKSLW